MGWTSGWAIPVATGLFGNDGGAGFGGGRMPVVALKPAPGE